MLQTPRDTSDRYYSLAPYTMCRRASNNNNNNNNNNNCIVWWKSEHEEALMAVSGLAENGQTGFSTWHGVVERRRAELQTEKQRY